MRSMMAALAAVWVMTGVASAQTPAAGAASRDTYIEGNIQSAFGNVTSQSFGGEVGTKLRPRLQVFLEVGRVRDSAPSSLGDAAQIIAGYLTQIQSASVGFSVKQPVGFGQVGIRYAIPYDEEFQPYLLVGGGLARVERDVEFTVGGANVTKTLEGFGVALGKDLAGNPMKPMATVGAGVVWYVDDAWFVDLQYRYGRIFTEQEGTNLSRAGIGVGFRF